MNGEFKEEMTKWRNYSRALGNFKFAQGKVSPLPSLCPCSART